MSTIANPEPDQPPEELVAYLDGELPPDESRRVELRLATDAEYRQLLQKLDQAWEALDSLPTPPGTDDLASTTMQLVTVAAEEELHRHTAGITAQRRRRAWRWTAAALLAMAGGFVAARAALPDPDRALLTDLSVIRQVDRLRHVDSVEFLRRLPEAVPLDRLAAHRDVALAPGEIPRPNHDEPLPIAARRQWVEGLAAEQRAALAGQARRFDELPEGEKARLRELDDAIRQADDADRLQANLHAYGRWVAGLTPGEREQLHEELAGLPADEQLDLVGQWVQYTDEQASRQLSADDADGLRKEIFRIVEERRPAIMRELRPRGEESSLRLLEGPRGAFFVVSSELRSREREAQVRRRLISRLSPDAQAHLEQLGAWGRRFQLLEWVRNALQPKWGPGELEQFFVNDLDNNQRERLLHLRPAEMQAELERLYLAAHFGLRDTQPWWGSGEATGGRRLPSEAAPPTRGPGAPPSRRR